VKKEVLGSAIWDTKLDKKKSFDGNMEREWPGD